MAVLAAASAALVVTLGAGAQGEDGQALFDRYCTSCHTIGGGKKVGPDLEGVADRRDAEWVTRFLLAPADVIPGTAMPDLGLSDAQVAALAAYLGFEAQQPPPTTTTPTETTLTPPAAEAEPERGKDLFTGADRFAEGGPACLSCHSVAGVGPLGGGQLGPDLTDALELYGGAQGLTAVLESLPFPTMAPVYSRKRLTAEERADLVAFLAAAPAQERPAAAMGILVALSVGVALALVLVALVVWRRRLTGVRRPLVSQPERE